MLQFCLSKSCWILNQVVLVHTVTIVLLSLKFWFICSICLYCHISAIGLICVLFVSELQCMPALRNWSCGYCVNRYRDYFEPFWHTCSLLFWMDFVYLKCWRRPKWRGRICGFYFVVMHLYIYSLKNCTLTEWVNSTNSTAEVGKRKACDGTSMLLTCVMFFSVNVFVPWILTGIQIVRM